MTHIILAIYFAKLNLGFLLRKYYFRLSEFYFIQVFRAQRRQQVTHTRCAMPRAGNSPNERPKPCKQGLADQKLRRPCRIKAGVKVQTGSGSEKRGSRWQWTKTS